MFSFLMIIFNFHAKIVALIPWISVTLWDENVSWFASRDKFQRLKLDVQLLLKGFPDKQNERHQQAILKGLSLQIISRHRQGDEFLMNWVPEKICYGDENDTSRKFAGVLEKGCGRTEMIGYSLYRPLHFEKVSH